ncbi:MAG: HVO_0649 family zinc finger protein [Halobacteriaceae archaeon]
MKDSGTNPFDKLRIHYEDIDMKCPECGYEDNESSWESFTNGREITYQHICPNCGKVRRRTITVSE